MNTVLSIIIVSYNCADFLIKCIKSLQNTIKELDYEIICVDNASKDNTIEIIKKRFPQVKLIINSVNKGFGAANNQAIKEAQGKYILFLNPDTIVHNSAIKKTIYFLEENPDVGIVGPKLLNPDGTIQLSYESFPSFWGYFLESFFVYHFFGKSKLIKKGLPINYKYKKPLQVDVVRGAYLLVRRKVIEQIGDFDTTFFMYCEENDFCYRARQKGWKTYIVPDAKVTHYGGQSSFSNWNYLFVELHKSKIKFHKKHYSKINTLFVAIVLFFGVVIRFILWMPPAIVAETIQFKNRLFVLSKFKNYFYAFKWYLNSGFRIIFK